MEQLETINRHITALRTNGNSLDKGFKLFQLVRKKLEIELRLGI